MAIKGKQIATGADGIATGNLVDGAVTPAKADLTQAWPFASDVSVAGNLYVSGSQTVVQGEQTALADNYLDLNFSYKADAAQSCGIVGNYDPTTTTTAVAGAGFVAGVVSVSNPTIEVTSTAGFTAGDIIHVTDGTGAAEPNNGFYEVDALLTTPARLQIKGVGTVATVEAWSKNQVATAGPLSANVTKTNVTVLRAGTDGVWETGKGATVPITYTDIQGNVSYATGVQLSVIDAGDAADAGVLAEVARGDHQHAVSTAAPGVTQLGTAAGEGVATTLARSDHIHKANTAAVGLAAAGAIGTGQDLARNDHAHPRDVEQQESITTQTITGDVALIDTLSALPVSVSAVELYLNGVFQEQGAGRDYTLGAPDNQTITWLAGTGTAVDMATSDVLIAKYISQG